MAVDKYYAIMATSNESHLESVAIAGVHEKSADAAGADLMSVTPNW